MGILSDPRRLEVKARLRKKRFDFLKFSDDAVRKLRLQTGRWRIKYLVYAIRDQRHLTTCRSSLLKIYENQKSFFS